MTTIYFIRHAQSDHSIRDENIRPLSQKGMNDRGLVTEFLKNKNIDIVLSSPYKRAIDTVEDFSSRYGFEIRLIDDFRERRIDSVWIEDFKAFSEKQWSDFSYRLSDGECLEEVQKRNITAFKEVLKEYADKNIVIGTHGTALSTIINHFDKSYGYEDFMKMVGIMPWVVKMDFDGEHCIGMQKIDLFNPNEPSVIQTINTFQLGELKAYRFVVIFARYQGKWLYCRHRERDIYETAGGHIEMLEDEKRFETTIEAAKRELYEETGAIKYDITPVFDYSVHTTTGYSNGQVFLADISELGELPSDFEMAEVKLFDAIPDKMRFPQILPVLYKKLQVWLNLQSAKDEIWDIYDENRMLTGRTHRRIDPIADGDYHLVVYACLQNSKGEFLITKRSPNKGYPNMWECTGGSAVAGDDSLTAAIREVKEETGLDVKPENGKCVLSSKGKDYFGDVWLFKQDFDIDEVVLQENETCDAKCASKEEILRMIDNGEFIDFNHIKELFDNI